MRMGIRAGAGSWRRRVTRSEPGRPRDLLPPLTAEHPSLCFLPPLLLPFPLETLWSPGLWDAAPPAPPLPSWL